MSAGRRLQGQPELLARGQSEDDAWREGPLGERMDRPAFGLQGGTRAFNTERSTASSVKPGDLTGDLGPVILFGRCTGSAPPAPSLDGDHGPQGCWFWDGTGFYPLVILATLGVRGHWYQHVPARAPHEHVTGETGTGSPEGFLGGPARDPAGTC